MGWALLGWIAPIRAAVFNCRRARTGPLVLRLGKQMQFLIIRNCISGGENASSHYAKNAF